ncbi:MAG TPA: rhodanese-like domain-containing protein [Polyangia bacterium]
MIRALVLVVAGAALGLAGNAARPHGLRIAAFAPATECSGGAEGGAPTPAVMSPAEASALCGQPSVVIADARAANAFAEGHVAGAVHLPCDAGGQTVVDALAHFSHAQTIVVYGQSTDDARPVADSLQRRHPDVKVAILDGGFAAWSQAGLACASGPCDECKATKVANP